MGRFWGLVGGVLWVVAGCSDSTSERAAPAPLNELVPSAKRDADEPRRGWRAVVGASRFELRHAAQRISIDAQRLRLDDRGEDANEPAPAFSLTRLSRDDRRPPRRSEPVLRDQRIVLDRGQAEEHLERRPNGLEQSFHFAAPPSGGGDLVVEIETPGLRFQHADATGLHFRAGQKLFHYGLATWLDADGAKLPVATRYVEGHIELRVSAQVVESAAYPVVLDPLIETELILALPVPLPSSQRPVVGRMQVGCNATQCLYAWADDDGVLVRRVSASGETPEASEHRIVVGDAYAAAVSADPNGNFLVVWGENDYSAPSTQVHVTMVSADSGLGTSAVIDQNLDDTLVVEATAVSQATHFLFFRRGTYGDVHRYYLRVKDGAALGTAVDLGSANENDALSATAGTNSVLLVVNKRYRRIDAASGALVDASPQKVSDLAEAAFTTPVTSTFDGQTFVLLWKSNDSTNVFAARLRESDGSLLDGVAGGRALCTNASASDAISASAVAGRINFVLSQGSNQLAVSAPSDPWTSSSAACAGLSTYTGIAPLRLFGDHAVVATQQDPQIITFNGDGNATTKTLASFASSHARRFGGVRTNGRDFLVVSEPMERIDGVTGQRLGQVTLPDTLKVDARAITHSGFDYVLRSGAKDFYRLSCDGQLGPKHPSGLHHLVCDPESCIGWVNEARSYHYDYDYHVVERDAVVYRYDNTGMPLSPFTAQVDGWNIDGAASLGSGSDRHFALFFNEVGDVRGPDPNAPGRHALATLGADGVVANLSWRANETRNFAWAHDGSHFAWFWTNGAAFVTNGALTQLAAVRPFSNEPWTGVDFPEYYSYQDFNNSADGEPIFDGTSYVIRGQHRVTLLDPTLQNVGEVPLSAQSDDYAPEQFYAANDHGRTLLARTAFLVDEGGYGIVGQFLDNDLSEEDPNSVPSDCVQVEETPNAFALPSAAGSGGTAGTAGTDAGGNGGVSDNAAGSGTINGGNAGTAGTGGSTPGTGGSTPDTGGSTPGTGGSTLGTDGAAPDAAGGAPDVAGLAGSAGGSAADAGGGADSAPGPSYESGAPGSDDQQSEAGASPSKPHLTPGGGGCSYSPASPSSAWFGLIGLLALTLWRRRPTAVKATA